jgi:D-glycero-D-manno-heptose 1,7-bisphosphate phosphatase
MSKLPYAIGLDRDGLLIKDTGYPGKGEDWKSKIQIYPEVTEGLTLLRRAPSSAVFVATNQAGVARGFFDERRIEVVNQFIQEQLTKNGSGVDGFIHCPWVDKRYAEKKSLLPSNSYVLADDDPKLKLRKPGIGMLEEASRRFNFQWPTPLGFYAGDKLKDVQTALNAGWIGIYVLNGENQGDDDYAKVQELARTNKKVWIASNFKDMAQRVYTEIITRERDRLREAMHH